MNAALVIVFAPIAIWVLWRGYRYSTSYIGFGWVIDRIKETGEVRVASRLLKGPAGKAGILNGDTLLTYNGAPLKFSSGEEHRGFWKKVSYYLKVGEKAVVGVKKGDKVVEVTLTAGFIFGSIPVYRPLATLNREDREDFRQGLAFCRKTGHIFQTRRLSDEALERIFASRG